MVAQRRLIDFLIGALQVVLDAFMIYSAFCLSYVSRFYTGFFSVPRGIPAFELYHMNFPIATLVMLFVNNSLKLYDRRGYEVRIKAWQVFKAATLGLFVLMSITFIYRDVTFSRLLFVIAWLYVFIFIVSSRWIVRMTEKFLNRRLHLSRNVLLVTDESYLKTFVQSLKKNKTHRI